ncbi:cilia- and flagella-associated protein 418 [Eucyclogobius newberryi]|uniref:cilia- and flagella-associated protein 418 n=1 Tax=Eucyclogobius newberryi TaxID=166745 RepID=UPI003B594CB0
MGDDLDRLLDEVERKFCGGPQCAGAGQARDKHEDEARKAGCAKLPLTTGTTGTPRTTGTTGTPRTTGTTGTPRTTVSTGTTVTPGTPGTPRTPRTTVSTGTTGTPRTTGSTGTTVSTGTPGTTVSTGTTGTTGTSDTDDLDAFIDKLLEDECAAVTAATTQSSSRGGAVQKKVSARSGARKCCPVFVGGSSVQSGIGTTTSKRSCDQLRCTSCDFSVLAFDDCEWDQSCHYLFFRNNVPERVKLRSKLRPRRGTRSYCCQCSWTSEDETKELKMRPRLQWVCAGKHQD